MSALEPGLYRATVRGVADVIVLVAESGFGHTMEMYSGDGRFPEYFHGPEKIADAIPLIMLDLDYIRLENYGLPAVLGALHRDHRTLNIAQQVEAQTKPARIPEPGLWGVVEAKVAAVYGPCNWVKDEYGWVSHSGVTVKWDLLIDPILIRAGVDS